MHCAGNSNELCHPPLAYCVKTSRLLLKMATFKAWNEDSLRSAKKTSALNRWWHHQHTADGTMGWALPRSLLHREHDSDTSSAFDNTPNLPVMVQLDLPPTIDEFSKTIDSIPHGKVAFQQKSSNARTQHHNPHLPTQAPLTVLGRRLCTQKMSLCTRTRGLHLLQRPRKKWVRTNVPISQNNIFS